MGKKVYKVSLSVVYNEPVEPEMISDKLCETFVAMGNNVALINVNSIKSVKDENKYIAELLNEAQSNIDSREKFKENENVTSFKKNGKKK